MKKKTVIFVILILLVLCFVGSIFFFVYRGLAADHKRREYFNIYRAEAEEYIRFSPEIIEKYGESVTVEMDSSVQYMENKEKENLLLYLFSEVFNPQVPDNIEEFSENLVLLEFKVKINGDEYIIRFEKDEQDTFCVSSLIPL